MNEFDIIRDCFAPLATSVGACGLQDDVAELAIADGQRLIVTTDALVEGVHFLPDDPLDSVGAKLVAVNVSDIVAKGGTPHSASLALVWPHSRPVADIRLFAEGLGRGLKARDIALLGGDTTRTPGPLTIALTLNGVCNGRGPVRRSGARDGDDVWVTGHVGDAGLGLKVALGELSVEGAAALLAAYREPCPPPAALAGIIAAHATASVDVSDGLLADAGHMAEASGVSIRIRQGDIPLSPAAREWALMGGYEAVAWLASAGDDYQSLFTAPRSSRDAILAAAGERGVRLSCIGQAMAGEGVVLVDGRGKPVPTVRTGWKHF